MIFKVDELVSHVFGVCFDYEVTMKFMFGRVKCVEETLALVGFTYDNSFIQSRINNFWQSTVFVETRIALILETFIWEVKSCLKDLREQ